jgi:hypothetical protein
LHRAGKRGRCDRELKQLAACIDRGIAAVQLNLDEVACDVVKIRLIWSTLAPETGPMSERKAAFDQLVVGLRSVPSPLHNHMAGIMERFEPGLFVAGPEDLPLDNLDLERWFRLPKAHERRIHGHAHAGVRIVQEGPTLLPTLDAHLRHPTPFTAEELIPTLRAVPPLCQRDAESRRKIMRSARSPKRRPILLAELERRYACVLGS